MADRPARPPGIAAPPAARAERRRESVVEGRDRTVLDGPFAESREPIGGFSIRKVKDRVVPSMPSPGATSPRMSASPEPT